MFNREHKIRKAVILASGKSPIANSFTDTIPRLMYPINERPFLGYLLKQIKSFGIADVVILVGYGNECIAEHFGDGKNLGLNIVYGISDAESALQTRALLAKNAVNEDFMLLYGNNYCPVNFNEMNKQFYNSDSLVQITAYDNADLYSKNNILCAEGSTVIVYGEEKCQSELNAIDIGYTLVRKKIFNFTDKMSDNFEDKICSKLIEKKLLTAYITSHRYYSVVSEEQIKLTKKFFMNQKVALLDRDGTLNVRPPKDCYVTKPEDFVWLDGAIEAVKLLNSNGYKVFLITNQAGVGHGVLSHETLDAIHKKMIAELEAAGAFINRIYMCVHGRNEGCTCRKPSPGMLYQAQKDFDFDLTKAVFFGDDERDMETAKRAGCRGVLISDKEDLYFAVKKEIDGNGDANCG